MRLPPEMFDAAVEEALTAIPKDIRAHLENLVITVEEEPSSEDLAALGMDEDDLLLGLYHGTPLPEREVTSYSGLPDRIVIYRLPLLEVCETRRELLREIRHTVIHEIGHYFGFGEEELP
ncbi:MAG: metallopeptidase family protein [Acidobacteria bacterium]|nr:metallopeptidase family protein [Acidobacteriota bacterium]